MDGAMGATPDEFSLGRKGHDLVLALICCVAFSKPLSFSGPPEVQEPLLALLTTVWWASVLKTD